MNEEIQVYLPGTITREVRGGIVSGEFVAMIEVHPDQTGPEERRWVRTRGDLATWATNSEQVREGVSIIAVGSPYRAEGAASRDNLPAQPVWMLEANRIAIDHASTP